MFVQYSFIFSSMMDEKFSPASHQYNKHIVGDIYSDNHFCLRQHIINIITSSV